MNQKNKKRFDTVGKTIKSFMRDEDGFVDKGKILKISLGTVATLGILSSTFNSQALGHANYRHQNYAGPSDPQITHMNGQLNLTSHANTVTLQNITGMTGCQEIVHSNANNVLKTYVLNGGINGTATYRDFYNQWGEGGKIYEV
ncbi:MAG: hypothetical protein ABH865_03270 [Candidatus Omnitrophota bacterium]|nr:hypothetical protein [Candidatus Omnitrophota bacterium]